MRFAVHWFRALTGDVGFDAWRAHLVPPLTPTVMRGRTVDAYRQSLVEIYDAIATLQLPRGRTAAISIPDWSAVSAARDYGEPQVIHVRRHAGRLA